MLKGLLALYTALNPAGEKKDLSADEVAAAAKEFTAGDDALRTVRQLYAANRLVKKKVALQTALELTEAAMAGVEAALDHAAAPVAILADDLRDARASAIEAGGTLDLPRIPRHILSNILRGRIEDTAGWTLFNLDKADEAVVRLRRAVSVLPENTPMWRASLWRLGAALEASGNQTEALAAYIKSFDRRDPDPVRRIVIEALYRKVNGSLDGLDEKIGPAQAALSNDEPADTAPAQPKQQSSQPSQRTPE